MAGLIVIGPSVWKTSSQLLKEHEIRLDEQNCGCSAQCPPGKGLLRGRRMFEVGGTWGCHGEDLLGPQGVSDISPRFCKGHIL